MNARDERKGMLGLERLKDCWGFAVRGMWVRFRYDLIGTLVGAGEGRVFWYWYWLRYHGNVHSNSFLPFTLSAGFLKESVHRYHHNPDILNGSSRHRGSYLNFLGASFFDGGLIGLDLLSTLCTSTILLDFPLLYCGGCMCASYVLLFVFRGDGCFTLSYILCELAR